jgi:HEAT repeat protein
MPELEQKTLHELVDVVKHGDDVSIRREAIIVLSYEKDPSLYPLLMEQLEDKSSSIRHAAVIALGRYGNPAAIEELIKPKILNAVEVNTRWAAVVALGQLGNYQIIDYLVKAAGDSEWIVRNQAVTELKEKIRDVIKEKESRTVRLLIRLLAMKDEEIIELVVEGLVKLGPVSFRLLCDALKSPSAEMRKNAARALGQMRADLAVDSITGLLQDTNWPVRRSAVEALGTILDERAVEPLVRCLADNVEKVQRQARLSLVPFKVLAVDPLLNACAHEKSKFVLRAMLLTLGDIAEPKSIPCLVKHLRSSYFVVRRAAVQALIRFGPPVIPHLLPLLSYHKTSIRSLLEDASNLEKPLLQVRAIHALGGLEDHRAVKILKSLAQTGEDEVRAAAVEALSKIGCAAWSRCSALQVLRAVADTSQIPAIEAMLYDDSDNVRLEAVLSLSRIGGPDTIRPLIRVASDDRDPYIRFEAVRQLRRIGVGYHEVLGLALQALEDPNRDVRRQAAWLLGNFQDEQSIPALMKAMSDAHWSVRESAEIALHNFGDRAVPLLIEALFAKSWTTQFRAARLLGDLGDERAIQSLQKLLSRRRLKVKVKTVAEEALEKIKKRLNP